jgi:hypothetical protein
MMTRFESHVLRPSLLISKKVRKQRLVQRGQRSCEPPEVGESDTDTNAAVVGALLGTVHGRVDVPAQWTDRITTTSASVGASSIRIGELKCATRLHRRLSRATLSANWWLKVAGV